MNTYYITEYGKEMTYLELRLCAVLDCEGRIQKVTDVLNFLNIHDFLTNLVVVYDNTMRAENFNERMDIPSLTIDLRDDKFRFKYWNGSETLWTYHTEDLFDELITGRDDYAKIFNRYKPVTDVIRDVKSRFKNSIERMNYTYYPHEEIEISYHLVFTKEIKESQTQNKLLDIINKEIIMLGEDVTDDLKFTIDFSFSHRNCIPCEEAKKKREQENGNKGHDTG